jgi:hypothetical protein
VADDANDNNGGSDDNDDNMAGVIAGWAIGTFEYMLAFGM